MNRHDFTPMEWVQRALEQRGTLVDAARAGNPRVLAGLIAPAVRGFVLQRGKHGIREQMPSAHTTTFLWDYRRDQPEMAKLYAAAKASQWDGATALDWSIDVDPMNPERELVREEDIPIASLPAYRSLPEKQRLFHRSEVASWLLSQFLHGEQGALHAACQVTEAVQWFDGKLYGGTQVVDEARHVEVFHRYLTQKLGHLWQINDNLHVVIDALMRDGAWDVKFLGMQILIEGLALGAFGSMRAGTKEPLLKALLKNVITDEARHVHYGVIALREHYLHGIDEKTRRDREDWAFEMALLLRNRFLAHEVHEAHWAHVVSRAEWDRLVLASPFMARFRESTFRRIVPNLKRIGLLSSRIRPHYEALGLLAYEHERPANELTADDLLGETPSARA